MSIPFRESALSVIIVEVILLMIEILVIGIIDFIKERVSLIKYSNFKLWPGSLHRKRWWIFWNIVKRRIGNVTLYI